MNEGLPIAAAMICVSVTACSISRNEQAARANEPQQASADRHPASWSAAGNEPGWRLDVDDEQMTLWNYGESKASLPRPGGEGIIDDSRVTLDFGDDGRLSGRASDDGALILHSVDGGTITARRE